MSHYFSLYYSPGSSRFSLTCAFQRSLASSDKPRHFAAFEWGMNLSLIIIRIWWHLQIKHVKKYIYRDKPAGYLILLTGSVYEYSFNTYIIAQLLNKFSVIYGTQRFITALTRACCWSQFWDKWIQAISSYDFSLRSLFRRVQAQKVTTRSAMAFCPSVHKYHGLTLTERIFMKFRMWGLYKNLSTAIQCLLKSGKNNTVYLHTYTYFLSLVIVTFHSQTKTLFTER